MEKVQDKKMEINQYYNTKKKIVIVEPFYSGSHKDWANNYAKFSRHEVKIIKLPGRFWKWRMHGGAIELANTYLKNNYQPDLVLATDMLNLPIFKSIVQPKCPIYIYFHENQLTYPWSPNDKDLKLNRDKHYGFINYSSCLAADKVYFNSNYHYTSFIASLKKFLNQLPDYQGLNNIETITKKSQILHLGIDLKRFDINKTNIEASFIIVPLKISSLTDIKNNLYEIDKNLSISFIDNTGHI